MTASKREERIGPAIFHGFGSVSRSAMVRLVRDHYLRRPPQMTDTFEFWRDDDVAAVLTFGVPASRHAQVSASVEMTNAVVELNRLWIDDREKRGFASWFIAKCLKQMPPRIVVSYADTAEGHDGTVYRAANFKYAGWSDMDRRTPRSDYVVREKVTDLLGERIIERHSRDAFRSGAGADSQKRRRKPKIRYWTVTGNRREKKALERACLWPSLDWKTMPPPTYDGG